MIAFRLLSLGLCVSLIVLVIGVIAAYLNIKDSFQIIVAALSAIALLMAAIERRVRVPRPVKR